MKGIVFNLLEEIVDAEHGEDVWDDLLEAADLNGAYTSLGSYPDAEFLNLVEIAAARLGQPPDEIIRWFARRTIPLLAFKYPAFFSRHTSTRSFLLTLNDVIHPEVRKLYPGADVPVFDYDNCIGRYPGDELQFGEAALLVRARAYRGGGHTLPGDAGAEASGVHETRRCQVPVLLVIPAAGELRHESVPARPCRC